MSGLTNYDLEKPTYAFSGETSEFEDVLMKHNVITKEQALLNKGMKYEDVKEQLRKEALPEEEGTDYHNDDNNTPPRSEDEFEDSEDDDEFLASYRNQRLNDLKSSAEKLKARNKFGSVLAINRDDWATEVATASEENQWVVVVLTSTSVPECELIEGFLPSLATRFPATKFCKIASQSAIERWPDANLPTIFCYQNGEMQHQLLGHKQCGGPCTNEARLEWRLKILTVLPESTLEKDTCRDAKQMTITKTNHHMTDNRQGGAKMATYGESDDEDNYDV